MASSIPIPAEAHIAAYKYELIPWWIRSIVITISGVWSSGIFPPAESKQTNKQTNK